MYIFPIYISFEMSGKFRRPLVIKRNLLNIDQNEKYKFLRRKTFKRFFLIDHKIDSLYITQYLIAIVNVISK